MSSVAEYVRLRPLAHSGSAIADEAKDTVTAGTAVEASIERSFALFGPKAEAIFQIWALVEECATPDWDGSGAQAMSDFAAQQAEAFVRALPEGVPLPEFAPEPDGSISLDWIQSRNRVFSLSIGDGSRLAYAWLDGTDRGHAVARFDGDVVPARVLDGIKGIVIDGTAAFRAS